MAESVPMKTPVDDPEPASIEDTDKETIIDILKKKIWRSKKDSNKEAILDDPGTTSDNETNNDDPGTTSDNETNNDDPEPASIEDTDNETNNDNKDETRRLRNWLKFYLYSPVKLQGDSCSIHVVYSILLLMQIIKIMLITSQMVNFGYDHGNFSEVVNRGHLTLRHLLLKDWDASWETLAYPPAQGDFAVYTIDDLESGINFAVRGYYNAEKDAIGYFQRKTIDTMVIQVKYFDFPGFKDANVTQGVIIQDITFSADRGLSQQNQIYDYDIIKELTGNGLQQPIKRMLSTELRFSIHSVRVYEKVRLARCLRVQGLVTFNDMDNNGQVIVNLETLTRRIKCEHLNITVKDWALENTSTSMGAVLIVFCLLSLFASAAIILLAVYIFMKTKSYMKVNYVSYYNPVDPTEKDLPMREYWRLVNFWEIAVLISDILTIYGTIWIVFENEHSEWIVETLDSYTVWLGFGCLFAWISLLRFFKFHNKFHLLFRTLFKAFGNVLAYLLCVTVLFIGFWMCGFVVLSPYHVKFRTPETAAETLFSMVNGDEIFTTLAMLETNKIGGKWVWWFSRVYFGAYIAIFTIVVINLLIAIYMSAYESIRNYYKNGPEERDLGPMGKAWRKYLSEKRPNEHNPISKSICTFLKALTDDKRQFSKGEESLRDEMKRLVRVESNKPILIKPRTLRAFMNEEEDTPTVINCGCFNINFLTFFNKEKITYEPFKNCKMLTKQKT